MLLDFCFNCTTFEVSCQEILLFLFLEVFLLKKSYFTFFIFMQPMSMVLPGVVGFKLLGKLRDGVTATDLVLTATQMLRKHGVVGKFVEFYGKSINAIVLICYFNLFGSHCCLFSYFLNIRRWSLLCYAGEGMSELSLADRATIANMSPEYGATMGFFPVDHVTLQYLRLTGRTDDTVSHYLIIFFCFFFCFPT